ncbi:MAG: hypothetical protein K6E92_02640 [Lachnospiraceae bacterium]|nr:hypothetical protein [Lachnospiraceae bacterium]
MAGFDIGSVTRAQDFSIIKHNEDVKPVMDQITLSQQGERRAQQLAQDVVDTEQSEWYQRREDAAEQGDNPYQGDGGKGRRQARPKEEEHPDRVVVKGRPSGFDLKI